MAPLAGTKFTQLLELHDGEVAKLRDANNRLLKENRLLRLQLRLPLDFELEIGFDDALDEVLPEFPEDCSSERCTVSLPRESRPSLASVKDGNLGGPPCLLTRISAMSGPEAGPETGAAKGAKASQLRASGITENLVLQSRWSKEIKTMSSMGTTLLEEMHQTANRESADGRYRRQNQVRKTILKRNLPRTFPLHPSSPSRLAWDAIALVLLFYDVVYIPLGALSPPSSPVTDALDWISLIFWTCDMFVTCVSAYFFQGEVVIDYGRIVKNYLKTWFALDVVVLLPDWLERVGKVSEESGEAFKIIRSFRFLRTLRLLRLLKLQKLLAMVYDLIDSEFTFIMFTCVRLIFFIVILNHYIACVWYWLGLTSIENGLDSWMNIGDTPIIQKNLPYRYTTAMHWSLTQFTPASMEISARNTFERIFSIVILFFALLVFSSVVGQVTSSMMSLQNMQASSRKQFWLLRRYLKGREVPKKSRSRIIRFLEQRVPKESQKVQQKDIKILGLLSDPLKDLLAWELHRRLLGRHRLFYILHGAIEPMMMRICSVAVSESACAEQDVLFCRGENATHMTFVNSGVFLYEPGYDFQGSTELSPFSWLVEPCLWTDWQHLGSLTTVEPGELCHLDPNKFADVMKAHIWPWSFCKQYACGFLETLKDLDAQDFSDLLGQDVVDHGLGQAISSARAEADQIDMDWLTEINDGWSDLQRKGNSVRSIAARLTRASKLSR